MINERMANFCLRTGMTPQQYRELTFDEREAFRQALDG